MKKIWAVLTTAVIAMGMVIGGFAVSASATDQSDQTYVGVVWEIPVKPVDNRTSNYPQTIVSIVDLSTPTLPVAPDTCGKYYQSDVYIDTPALRDFLDDGDAIMNGPVGEEDSQYLAPGGWDEVYSITINDDCAVTPPPTTPPSTPPATIPPTAPPTQTAVAVPPTDTIGHDTNAFDVTLAPEQPTLAETGFEPYAILAGGAFLLVIGTGLFIFWRQRRINEQLNHK